MTLVSSRNEITATAGCCLSSAAGDLATARAGSDSARPAESLSDFVTVDGDGVCRIGLYTDGVHCSGCIAAIEGALGRLPDMLEARLNLTSRRLRLAWRGDAERVNLFAGTVRSLGYAVMPVDDDAADQPGSREERQLLAALAIAGFAAANVMLLSVSVWSGHVSGMGEGTRTLFHWLSALIALPAIAWSGRPFFRSAWRALAKRRLNMDVPIALAVVLASMMSVAQTAMAAEHAYFDAAITLLFFLLVGRYLDQRMRSRARSAAARLAGLAPRRATRISDDGRLTETRVEDLTAGMRIQIMPGDRLPVDGRIEAGTSSLDASLLTGESLPRTVRPGDTVHAGTVNLDGLLTVRVLAVGNATLLADIARMTEAAEGRKTEYIRLADRLAQWYAPVVHIVSAAAFLGWLLVGGGWVWSLTVAITALIITCPCALGLAVPATQTVAVGRLLARGVVVKAADGLERLAEIDTVVFDKTGTLTEGRPVLLDPENHDSRDLALAAALARHSRHPFSRALVAAGDPGELIIRDVREEAGAGLEGLLDGQPVRLGSARWCGVGEQLPETGTDSLVWLRRGDQPAIAFRFEDRLRDDAISAVTGLRQAGLALYLLSGDQPGPVTEAAGRLGITNAQAGLSPGDKLRIIETLRADGCRVLMVGDGLNDAPALAAGHASAALGDAADISRMASDVVLQGNRLRDLVELVVVARAAKRIAFQNFAMALLYNLVAVPVAVLGFATPLVAAVAMSSSSLLVTLNALRLRLVARRIG
ncbi:MAG: heavy metal translocating P-type ATPase [Rhodospirillales bacterium]